MPYLPLYLAHLGFSGTEIGVAVGLPSVLRWTGAIAWAHLADRWRVRHRLLVVLALAGGALTVPLLVVRGFPAVALVLGATALMHGPLIPLLDATVMDNLPRLGGDYGRLRLWGSMSFILGALGSAPLVAAFSPAVIPLLLLLPNLGLAPALFTLPRAQHGRAAAFRPPWRLLTPPLTAFLATVFLVQTSSGAWGGIFAVHTAALGLPSSVPGVAWGLAVAAEVVLFRWGRPLLARISAPRLVLAVVVLTAGRWVATAYAERAWLVVALQLGHGISFSALHLAAQVLLARLVPGESSSGGQALYGLAGFGLGGSGGMWLAGTLADRMSTSSVFLVDAGIALLALPFALRLRRLASR